MSSPPRNPYVAGKALSSASGFVGREDVFNLVETVLSSPNQNSVVLFGQRRIGKTSILLNLRSRLPSPPFVTVYFDLMDRARKPLVDVLYELSATIAQDLHLPQPSISDFSEDGRGLREKFLPIVYSALGEKNRLVLLFDEFDVLDVRQEEQLSANTAARAFFPYLRTLMTEELRLGFVFVVGRKAEDLGIEFKAAFKASRYYRVSMLEEESARILVLRAEREGTLEFGEGAVDRILALTSRHPYLTQLMCQLNFERAYRQQVTPDGIPALTINDVDSSVPQVLEAGENVFEWIWEGLPPAERVIFSAIAEGTDEQTVVSEDRLLSILQSQGIRILVRELELAPKTLIEWEMLSQIDGGYKFRVELMRRWVAERKPLAKVKDELDRVVPLADTLYQGANGFYRRGSEMFDNAITQLRSALNVNPNHLKAHLLLGEIYRSQGKFDDAVSEFERAQRIDQDAVRIPLETVLLQRAESFEKNNQIEQALADYSHALAISPNSRTARERYQSIWFERGKVAFEADDLEKARSAFQEAGATDKIAEIDALQRRRENEKLAAAADELVRREVWSEAIAAYQRLIELDSTDDRWKEGLVRAKQESELAHRYAEALGAMQQNKWAEAQRALADVVNLRPEYKDAAERLAKVTRQAKARGAPKPVMVTPSSVSVSKNATPISIQPTDTKSSQRKSSPRLLVPILIILGVVIIVGGIGLMYFNRSSSLIYSIAISPDGTLLASGSSDDTVRLWNLNNGALVRSWKADPNAITDFVAFSPDGSILGSGGIRFLKLWKTSDGSLVRDLKPTDSVTSIAFSPDGNQFASGQYRGTIYLWKPSDGSLIRTMSAISETHSVAFSPDGNLLASGSDNVVRLWKTGDGSLVRELNGHQASVNSVAFSPDGSLLASGGNDNKVLLWNTSDGTLARELKGNYLPVESVAFSRDGKLLASGSWATVRLWKVSDGSLIREWRGATRYINSVTFTPDGSQVAAGSSDGTILIWKTSDGSLVRTLRCSTYFEVITECLF